MRRIIPVLLVLGALLSARAEDASAPGSKKETPDKAKPTDEKADDKNDEARIQKEMQTRLSFEFAQTPVEEVFEFIREKTKLNIVLDPDVDDGAGPRNISMKLNDMRVESALQLICRQARLKFDVENEALYVVPDEDAAPPPEPPKPEPPPAKPTGKLRLRMGNGNEIEADADVFSQKPEMLDDVIQHFVGAPERQIVSVYLANDNPNREGLITMLTNLANTAEITVAYEADLNLLVMRGRNTRMLSDLYDVALTALKQKRPPQDKLEKPERTEKMVELEVNPKEKTKEPKAPKLKEPQF